eukprot:364843-Chlamydomonas_euryale.AAC.13
MPRCVQGCNVCAPFLRLTCPTVRALKFSWCFFSARSRHTRKSTHTPCRVRIRALSPRACNAGRPSPVGML